VGFQVDSQQAARELGAWNNSNTPHLAAAHASVSEDEMWAPFKEISLSHWLEEQHASHDILLYVCDSDLQAPWSRRCLRHADVHLVVADSCVDPTLPPTQAAIREVAHVVAQSSKRVELVLLRHVRWGDEEPAPAAASQGAPDRFSFQRGDERDDAEVSLNRTWVTLRAR
jgi:hypothetical protein